MTSPNPSQAPYKQLRRPVSDRMIAGVASGLGRYFAADPTLIRVIFATATLLTGGVAALAYPIMWFLMPEEPDGAPAWPHPPGTAPGWPPVPPTTPGPWVPPATPAPPRTPAGPDAGAQATRPDAGAPPAA
ncbi:PspC domain-containing protein [Micromonospora sp. AMSO1212t]|uniref:Phage shock protein C (PspC) family protein n=1 Tax=Micromonospora tulbaghiae TaxID=479978 RepID=A0ABY0KSH3_9ACTN|nr:MULTISPECIES: PspC domain-containing protein [Micromonospora]KAB1900753.1 PspC domain-containing protein [Micromonospora sp. AMSO1212t]MDX5460021.1 PspC domain-containing protein [Micromonospora tulbaghiae]SCF06640.1 phage shock protein C (PspC) family protein [Micromonospora tulbaghiae]